jgi:transposase
MDTIELNGVGGSSRDESVRARRRKSYTLEEKRQLVAESNEPGASVSVVARRHDINANLLFTWRRQLHAPGPVASPLDLIPVDVVESASGAVPTVPEETERRGMMEIILVGGARVRVDATVREAALRRVLSAMKATA